MTEHESEEKLTTVALNNVAEVNDYVRTNKVLAWADIPPDIYHATDAVSHSTLRHMRQSPSKFKWELSHPKASSPAQTIGTAIHMALLEPERFDKTYRVQPKFDGRTKAGKESKEKWEQENGDKEPISQSDMDTVIRVINRVERDSFLRKLFTSGKTEKSFFKVDDETGLTLRCRPDCILTSPSNIVIDLKTTDCADEWVFKGDIERYGYLTQASFYMDMIESTVGSRPDNYLIVAVEKSRDCDVNVFFFSNDSLSKGTAMYRKWLLTLAECRRSDKWPGYERRFIQYDVPEWLSKKLEMEEMQ